MRLFEGSIKIEKKYLITLFAAHFDAKMIILRYSYQKLQNFEHQII